MEKDLENYTQLVVLIFKILLLSILKALLYLSIAKV